MEPEKKKHSLKVLALIEIGILDVGLVLILFILLFTALNYFNILNVSGAFPKYLSWLPKQKVKINNNQIYNDFLKQYYGSKGTPTPTPISSEETAKKLLADYLSAILNSSVLPAYSLIKLAENNNSDNSLTFKWNKNSIDSVATFDMWIDKNPSYIYLSMVKDINVGIASLSAELAKEYLSGFFSIEPKGIWGCAQSFENIYCENFWEEKDLKRGVGMRHATLSPSRKILIVSFCEFGKTSSLYENKSCLIQFAKNGVLTNP